MTWRAHHLKALPVGGAGGGGGAAGAGAEAGGVRVRRGRVLQLETCVCKHGIQTLFALYP
jgi:hypothetical protein